MESEMSREDRALIGQKLFGSVIRLGEAELEHFSRMNRNAPAVNHAFLRDCITRNAGTEFGRRYGFDSIHSYEDYAGRVPVCDWNVFRPYVERMADDGQNGLLCKDPVTGFYFTSGTTSRPKWIPCTRKSIQIQRRYLVNALFGTVAREIGNIWADGFVLLLGEAAMTRTRAGLQVSNVSARTIAGPGGLGSYLFTSPMEVLMPETVMESMALHTRFALENHRIVDIRSSYAVYPLEMVHYLENHWESLAEQLEYGTLDRELQLPSHIRASLERQLVPRPERAKVLRDAFTKPDGTPLLMRLWPGLRVICSGTGADYGIYEKQLRRYTGDVCFYHYGYTASEGIFSIPEKLNNHDTLMIADSAFYEFCLDDGRILTMDQLEQGMSCRLLITNAAGLYRYPMGDRIEITGFKDTCPRIRLMGRENRTLDLTCEKLHMPLVNEVVLEACNAVDAGFLHYTVYADREASPLPRYVFFLETERKPDMTRLYQTLTDGLRRISEELSQKLDGGKIAFPVVARLRPGTWDAFMGPLQDQAAREGRQLKPVCLLSTSEEADWFRAHVIDMVPTG